METLNTPVSACRYCQFYKPTGRRGGSCQMLGVSVQSGWKACHLGTTKFSPLSESYPPAKSYETLTPSPIEKPVRELSELPPQKFNYS